MITAKLADDGIERLPWARAVQDCINEQWAGIRVNAMPVLIAEWISVPAAGRNYALTTRTHLEQDAGPLAQIHLLHCERVVLEQAADHLNG